MHTLFTLEDRYGLEACECEDEVHLRVHIHKGRDAAELHRMLAAWGAVAAKLKAGEITKEEYDRWRYHYPELRHLRSVAQDHAVAGTDTELQLKSLEKILIARRARSSYETCFVISFLINHKTGSAIRRCLPD